MNILSNPHVDLNNARNLRPSVPRPVPIQVIHKSEWVEALLARWERELDEIPLDTTTGRESYDRLHNCILQLKEAAHRSA